MAIGAETPGGETADQITDASAEAAYAEDTVQLQEEWIEEEDSPRSFAWLAPALAIVAVVAWTAFFAWVHQRTLLAGASPAQWSRWIIDWSVPVLLVVGLWLVAMRNSRREASRFAAAAQSLSQESRLLERRLTTVNRELSMARDFIAAQSRDLESLGRVAAERLSQHADRLQGLIHDNGAQVEAIGRVSTTALENMDRLRDDLPVISNSARDVASQIGHAGGVAKDQLEELIGGFNRLNQFGEASGRQVAALRAKIDEALTAFEAQAAQLNEIAGERFTLLADSSATFRAELEGREVEALAAIRRRADALSRELDGRREELERAEATAVEALQQRLVVLRDEGVRVAETLRTGERDAIETWTASISQLEQRMLEAIRQISDIDQHATENARQRLASLSEEAQRIDASMSERVEMFHAQVKRRAIEAAEREEAALAGLHQRLATLDTEVTERQQEQLAHVAGLAERGDALARRLAELSAQLENLSAQGRDTHENVAEAAANLTARLAESRALLDTSGTQVARLTDDSVRLLELIRSSAEHGNTDLPKALGQAEQRLAAFERQTQALHSLIADAGDKGAALYLHVENARQTGSATLGQLQELENRLAQVAQSSNALAAQARSELADAIATLEQSSREMFTGLQHHQAEAIRAIADRIAGESTEAIDAALRAHAASAIAELDAAARKAAESGRETAIALRDQLATVNELAGNLEQRVAHARQQAEEQVDSDFARRAALITESLNSSAIDISKAFANDVADTAWASYLRGDRGIFTRRAVRLLDNHEARAIAGIYEEDGDFRETVNRYIHDFEAMLRSVLSTRDGNTMAVTLLSSDMGKLYVALAQAIERLRS